MTFYASSLQEESADIKSWPALVYTEAEALPEAETSEWDMLEQIDKIKSNKSSEASLLWILRKLRTEADELITIRNFIKTQLLSWRVTKCSTYPWKSC